MMSKTHKDKPERFQERDKRREKHPKPYRRSNGNRDISGEDNWREDTDNDDQLGLRSGMVVQIPANHYVEPHCPICQETMFLCVCDSEL